MYVSTREQAPPIEVWFFGNDVGPIKVVQFKVSDKHESSYESGSEQKLAYWSQTHWSLGPYYNDRE